MLMLHNEMLHYKNMKRYLEMLLSSFIEWEKYNLWIATYNKHTHTHNVVIITYRINCKVFWEHIYSDATVSCVCLCVFVYVYIKIISSTSILFETENLGWKDRMKRKKKTLIK